MPTTDTLPESQRRIAASEFDPDALPRGQRYRMALCLPGTELIEIPMLVVRGKEPGPTLAASAAVHGDEFEGIQTIYEVFNALDPAAMRGDLLAVPIANPPAFRASSRESPLDGKNLARVFPGREEGSPTEKIAYWMSRVLIDRADLYVDFHSSGARWAMPFLVGYHAADPRAAAAARSFGSPLLWAHGTVAPGRTLSRAIERGIPALYTETYGGGTVHASDLACYKRGLHNLLRHCGIVDEPLIPGPVSSYLTGNGDLDCSVAATNAGFFVPEVALMQDLEQDAVVGKVLGALGDVLEVIRAPRAGTVVLLRTLPPVSPGDPLVFLTDRRT